VPRPSTSDLTDQYLLAGAAPDSLPLESGAVPLLQERNVMRVKKIVASAGVAGDAIGGWSYRPAA
jgi:hypothetical protein